MLAHIRVGKTCQGCGASPHQGGRRQCPAFNATCHMCNKVGHLARGHLARVCRGRRAVRGAEPAARGVYTDPQVDEPPPQIHASRAFEPAPTISIHMSSLNGQSMIKVLPDSGLTSQWRAETSWNISMNSLAIYCPRTSHPEQSMAPRCTLWARYQ